MRPLVIVEAATVCVHTRAPQMLSLIRSLATDGGKVWKEKVFDNEMSFEGVFNANSNVDIIQAQALAKTAKQEASK